MGAHAAPWSRLEAGLAALLLLGLSPAAHAVAGVLEINQTCAVNTGCFPGDSAGFPVNITASGSYRLTSNLVLPIVDATGILLSTPNVGIDLGGFEIVGAACVGAITDCTPASGSGDGIRGLSSFVGSSVRNGSITGMGGNGIQVADQAEVRNLRVRWNRGNGILAREGSTISGNAVLENGGVGIQVFGCNATVFGNAVHGNDGHGIEACASVISGNSSTSNGGHGILGRGSTITGNESSGNTDDGINAGSPSILSQSTVSNNTVTSNGDTGITARSSLVSGNTAARNIGSGVLIVSSGSRVEANNAYDNLRGIQVTGSGNIVLKNTASNNSAGNFDMGSGNAYGPLVGVVGVGDIGGTAGADHPWANFGY